MFLVWKTEHDEEKYWHQHRKELHEREIQETKVYVERLNVECERSLRKP